MAAIYWRGDDRTGSWWLKTYHPLTKAAVRQSLETVDKARAELIRKRVELEVELQRLPVSTIVIPEKLSCALGLHTNSTEAVTETNATGSGDPHIPSVLIEEVLFEFVAYVQAENSKAHAGNKLSYLKKFFGSQKMGLTDGIKGVFAGETLADVKVGAVRAMIDSMPVGRTTKRHHREAFHSLFEFAMKYSYFIPSNFRYPNPMSGLPAYRDKNRPIIFLKKAEVEHLLNILTPHPSVQIAVALMIFGGLRRAEALWLTRDAIDPELRYMSIVNKVDEERDIESRLKTGERAVPILPQLRELLEPYLAKLDTNWIIPSPRGGQWDADNFGEKHRTLLKPYKLPHTCLHYRHTFATNRASESWSLFRISKIMGNSVAVCEQYYAAYVNPSQE